MMMLLLLLLLHYDDRLLHQRVDPIKMIFAIVLQTQIRLQNEVNLDFKNILQNLDHVEKTLLPALREPENEFEIIVYKVLILFTKAIVHWKAKMKEYGNCVHSNTTINQKSALNTKQTQTHTH
jgi:hypothetical protein